MEIGRQGLQSMHLNNASMFKEWSHGWEVLGFSCAGFCSGLPCFHLPYFENLLDVLICNYQRLD